MKILVLLFFLLEQTTSDCPFARFRNPGFVCFDEVDKNLHPVDYIIEIIHEKNTVAMDEQKCLIDQVQCTKNNPYRSYSGYCNNLIDPAQGAAFAIFPRKLSNAYEDGVNSPRSLSKKGDGTLLPSPRRISLNVNYLVHPSVHQSGVHNHFFAIFSQYLGHDLTYTPLVPAIEECRECDTQHPECMPIIHLRVDDDFQMQSCEPCSEFTRSANGNTDTSPAAIREQLNQVSSYLDLSQVYGSDKATADMLRDFSNEKGMLKSQNNHLFLPQTGTGDQCSPLSPEECFLAGDNRNGENAGLASIHTLYMKEHNRIAQFFADNTAWDGDTIFQKTRQIVIAVYQHTVYAELLPNFLSDELMTQYNLYEETEGNYFTDYDETVDATPFNEFSTAAYRFGHSIVHYRNNYRNGTGVLVPLPMKENWYNVAKVKAENLVPMNVISNMLDQPSQLRDKHFVFVMHHELLQVKEDGFIRTPPFDINSLNIQRGRDHGLQSYNQYRIAYGLNGLSSFEQLEADNIARDNEIVPALKMVYGDGNVEDMDLFTGITFENVPEKDQVRGILGDVAGHMIAEHFRKLKYGDRYFYSGDSTNNPGHFSPEQLKEIRRMTMASVICEHTDHSITEVNLENTFLKMGMSDCENVMKLDLRVFLSPDATPHASTIMENTKLKRFNKDISKLRNFKPATSPDHCDRICRQESECIAWEFRPKNDDCLMWKDITAEGAITGDSPVDDPRTFGIVPTESWVVTPATPTFTGQDETYSVTPRCGLIKKGTNDEGVVFIDS